MPPHQPHYSGPTCAILSRTYAALEPPLDLSRTCAALDSSLRHPSFQARLAATGFHQLAMDAPVADKARVMLSILQNAWPATVSEMLMDTGAR